MSDVPPIATHPNYCKACPAGVAVTDFRFVKRTGQWVQYHCCLKHRRATGLNRLKNKRKHTKEEKQPEEEEEQQEEDDEQPGSTSGEDERSCRVVSCCVVSC